MKKQRIAYVSELLTSTNQLMKGTCNISLQHIHASRYKGRVSIQILAKKFKSLTYSPRYIFVVLKLIKNKTR